MEKLKIGMIGAGNIACNAHLPAYAKCNNATVVAIMDINRERAEAAAKQYGIPKVYDTLEELLADEEVQAVDICTWNNGHAPCAIAAAKAGKHVMCEKPLTVSDECAYAIQEAIKEAGVKFFLAVPGRFGHRGFAPGDSSSLS